MKTYIARRPFVVLVRSTSSEGSQYRFIDLNRPVSLDLTQSKETNTATEAWLRLGGDFSIAAKFASEERPSIHEYSVTMGGLTLMDYNADGCFDLRVDLKPDIRTEIWWQRQWLNVGVQGGSKYRKQLDDGTWCSFDLLTGRWVREGQVNP